MKMQSKITERFLMISSYAPSFLGFRAPLIDALRRTGLEVHLAAPVSSIDSDVRTQLEGKGLILHGFPMQRAGTNPASDLMSLWGLWRLTSRLKPQYVLSYTIKPVIYGTLAAWLARVPHRFALITGLGYAFQQEQRSRLRVIAERLYSTALARVHRVFFQNPDDRALFLQHKILRSKDLSCVVNGSGVDLEDFAVQPLPEGGPHFLFMGRLMVSKGIREYVEAARMVSHQHPDARFVILGGFDDNPESISETELNGWISEGFLHYAGCVDDVRPILAGCNVFVLPSYSEGTPHSSLEAMSMGRAVITTDVPGCRETVVDGVNGFLVNVKSSKALAEAMCKFTLEPNLIEIMGKESRKLAVEKFDVHKVNAIMLHEMKIS